MLTALEFQVLHVDAVFTRTPSVKRSLVLAVRMIVLDFRLRRALELVAVIFQVIFKTIIAHHVVAGSMSMENRYRTLSRACTHHQVARAGGKGRNLVGNLTHGMVRKHTAHGETRHVHALGVNLVVLGQLVDNLRNPFGILVTADIPGTVTRCSLGIGYNKARPRESNLLQSH